MDPMLAANEERTCIICFTDAELGGGIECASSDGEGPPHFTCCECLSLYVVEEVSGVNLPRFSERGGIRCAAPTCAARVFTDGALARSLPDDTFSTYAEAKQKLAEQRINAELERNFEARLATERQRFATVNADESARRARQHIVERILTLACPRCGQAFLDFNGCFALTCSRCQAGFCAYCLADCGTDAHAHVASCPHGRGGYHGSFGVFEAAQRERRARMVKDYVETLPKDEAERALRECERELADLGIKLGEDGMLHAEGAQQRTQPHGGAAADGMGHAGYAPVADPRYNPRVQGVR